jgi:phosphatidylcholine synthase
LPAFDGRKLDDLIDYLTYTALPLLLIWRARIVPVGPAELFLLVPLLASAYGFCQVEAKTEDAHFRGFPSYWNIVAFYLYVWHEYLVRLPGWFSIGMLLVFSLLTFVPTRYLYPSQGGRLNRLTNLLAAVWVCLVVWILYRWPAPGPGSFSDGGLVRVLILVSLFFPVYYMVASWVISWQLWRGRRRRPTEPSGVPCR